ncbi:recombination-associated protein RdgC [Zooshikella sp. RANM57]|uniref:recombination-associated protein RdgC n=1 Tax=Zooshikella sp. RANM57 TaxID=3425863 RepID=UPI003D7015E3
MLFKNAYIFSYPAASSELNLENLSDNLAQEKFKECTSQQHSSYGFVPPVPGNESYIRVVNRCVLFCLQTQEKVLPAKVIKNEVSKEVESIKAREERNVGKKETAKIKEDVLCRLLPDAFSQYSKVYGYIDLENGFLIINASTARKAELVSSLLRNAMGRLKVFIFITKSNPSRIFSDWVFKDGPPEVIQLDDQIELKDDVDNSVARIHGQNIASIRGEALVHYKAGKKISKLGIVYDGLSCVLHNDCQLKSLKFDENLSFSCESGFNACFLIQSRLISGLYSYLIKLFGGLEFK